MTAVPTSNAFAPVARLSLKVNGAVQGVGMRPFVHRLATEMRLAGYVRNGADGVTIEVEGNARRGVCAASQVGSTTTCSH